MSTHFPDLPIDPSRVEIIPTREEWIASRFRDYRIGGSDVPKILNRSPESHGGPWDFWLSRKNPTPQTWADTAEQGRGKRYEVRVLEDYRDDFGVHVWMPRDFFNAPKGAEVVLHGRYPWMCATVDALGFCPVLGSWGIPEAKTSALADEWGPSQEIHRWTDDHVRIVPPHIALQGYWYLACTDLPWLDICALIISQANAGLLVRRYRFFRHVELQENLIETIADWRQRHLIDGEPPPITSEDECRRFLGTRFGKSDTFRDPQPEELRLALEFVEVKRRMKADEERKAILEATLLQKMGESGGLFLPALKANGKGRQVLRRVYVAPYEVEARMQESRHQPATAYLLVPRG